MGNVALRVWVTVRSAAIRCRQRLGEEVGEGVISTAIVVLIMALIGLGMWQLFDQVFDDAGERIERNVNDIG